MRKKLISVLLILVMLAGFSPSMTAEAATKKEYETFKTTGNQANDVVTYALSRVGKKDERSKMCAGFVATCAMAAGMTSKQIKLTATGASPWPASSQFSFLNSTGGTRLGCKAFTWKDFKSGKYVPQKGDLVFYGYIKGSSAGTANLTIKQLSSKDYYHVHVGIIRSNSCTTSKLYTVDGGQKGSDGKYTWVAKKTRSITASSGYAGWKSNGYKVYVMEFIRPDYKVICDHSDGYKTKWDGTKYVATVCKKCGETFNFKIDTSVAGTLYTSAKVSARSQPYSDAPAVIDYNAYDKVTVLGKTENAYGNVWYQVKKTVSGKEVKGYILGEKLTSTNPNVIADYDVSYFYNTSGKNYLYDTDFAVLNSDNLFSRDTAVSTISIDSSTKHNGFKSLKVVNTEAGRNGHDIVMKTTTQGCSTKGWIGNSKAMTLSFWAKSSVSGTTFSVRWGYEPTSNYRKVTLTTSWKKYTIRVDKTKICDNYLHWFLNAKGTFWMTEAQLEDGTSATAFVPEKGGTYTTKKSTYPGTFSLPAAPTRSGYTFDGWYTKAVDGTKITSSTASKCGKYAVYAHWTKNDTSTSEPESYYTYNVYYYRNFSGKNYIPDTDFTMLDSNNVFARDTAVSTVAIDSSNKHNGYNSLKIVNAEAGRNGHDIVMRTMTQNCNTKDWVGDTKTLTFSFWAKGTKDGATLSVRWGYEPTSNYRKVTLTTSWKKYTIRVDKTPICDDHLHWFIDAKGTFWMSEAQLEDGTSATAFVPENGGTYATMITKYPGKFSLPTAPTRSGYTFSGWYTKAVGGTKITSTTASENGNYALYAHWTQN